MNQMLSFRHVPSPARPSGRTGADDTDAPNLQSELIGTSKDGARRDWSKNRAEIGMRQERFSNRSRLSVRVSRIKLGDRVILDDALPI
jgi:hypothetical protein